MTTIDIFPWNEHFSTGLKTVDEQHKKLVTIINSLANHVAHKSNEDKLCAIFDELISILFIILKQKKLYGMSICQIIL